MDATHATRGLAAGTQTAGDAPPLAVDGVVQDGDVGAGSDGNAGAGVGAAGEGAVAAFWYRIGDSQPRVVRASSERAARTAVLTRHPEAAGRQIWLHPFGVPMP
jgi:hypothetical protein